jgi:hypothetical protein
MNTDIDLEKLQDSEIEEFQQPKFFRGNPMSNTAINHKLKIIGLMSGF